MNSIYNLRNIGQNAPVLSKQELKVYPSLNKDALECMEDKVLKEPSYVYVFPLVRENVYGGSYIDIYILDPFFSFMKRYILVPGYRLTESDEDELEEKLKSKSLRFMFWDKDFVEHAKMLAKPYFDDVDDVTHLLLGLCFVFYRSGIRELLFKQKLDYLGFHIESFYDINLMGTTSNEVFGVPQKALRFFNSEEGYKCLKDPDDRYLFARTYAMFSDFIGQEEKINVTQWKYLTKIYYGEGDAVFNPGRLKFKRSVFNALGKVDDCEVGESYLRYLYLKEAVSYRPHDNKLPSVEALPHTVKKLERIHTYRRCRKEYDRSIKEYAWENSKYEYVGDLYRVRLPRKMDDIFEMADRMGNCLESYVQDVARGYTMILFVDIRDEDDEICLEVNGKYVEQARRRYNASLTERDLEFLEEYCSKVGLEMDIYEL